MPAVRDVHPRRLNNCPWDIIDSALPSITHDVLSARST